MVSSSAAPLPPPPPVNEVADVTAMFLQHPQGYDKLIRILTGAADQHGQNYAAAAQAVVVGGTHCGPAAKALGSQQATHAIIDTLKKIQTGQIK